MVNERDRILEREGEDAHVSANERGIACIVMREFDASVTHFNMNVHHLNDSYIYPYHIVVG